MFGTPTAPTKPRPKRAPSLSLSALGMDALLELPVVGSLVSFLQTHPALVLMVRRRSIHRPHVAHSHAFDASRRVECTAHGSPHAPCVAQVLYMLYKQYQARQPWPDYGGTIDKVGSLAELARTALAS